MTLEELWAIWGDIHDEESQTKRIVSAKKVECTPLKLDREKVEAIFKGRASQYNSSLEYCECIDFRRNKKPCKHMYRLAMEMDLIEEQFESNLLKIIDQLAIDDALVVIESVSEGAQKVLQEFLYNNLYQKRENFGFIRTAETEELLDHNIIMNVGCQHSLFDPYGRNEINKLVTPFNIEGFKKNWKKEILVDWVVAEAPEIVPQITQDSISVTINPKFHKVKRKVYSHLNQKFQEDVSWLWE
ncbi:hypothetical protein SporoP37_15675 [Sporosarcina sp. P37]|uniref:SWIM zinc finger family protein n=1 Tax=unclassified Sporosarcina TaxID=2647733 RepID=UPI000A17AC92|nr:MULTISPECIES: SWIM zinc finger family protein [unclassified Sporosarcina]ARK25968.1 hypothetical protein SporoP37_15675 [Sporosarcina sp. P37]PID19335.1 hypothetical protein CSV62_02195 [Sporosarcina sp. P35]